MIISGRKAIHSIIQIEELKKLIQVIQISESQDYTIELCKKYKVNYEIKEKSFFNEHYGDKSKFKYKYAIAILKDPESLSLDDLLEKNKNENANGLLVILDHIQDPFNLGAILRTCAAAGVKGVILPKNNSAPLNHDATLKASQGLSLFVPVVTVSNLSQAISRLKKSGYGIYAANITDKSKSFKELRYPEKKVLILGNEGEGVSKLLQNISDYQIHIPMQKNIDSLNVSVAAGILIFEMTV